VVARLNKEIAAVLKQPEVATAFESQGMVPTSSAPAEFKELMTRDAQRWAGVVQRGGITAE
jgi:tripartite-type tricarboxylate transporter receptor subunit TctC